MKTIFHIDVNSAFLSWSAVRRLREDPDALDLRTVPAVVGGDMATRHGIVTAKSIPAGKYGIKTADTLASAMQKCPGLIVIPSDFETYREYSRGFMNILLHYTSQVEQASIDEAYMDATGLGDPQEVAGRIRREVRDTLGFTVNVGISTNRLLAKMASDFEKPDKTHTLYPDEIEAKLWPLPAGELYGCGRKTAEKLRRVGITTIGEAAEAPLSLLQSLLGEKGGEYIFRSSRGIGSDRIRTEREDAKSYSNEITTSHDITAENYAAEMGPLLLRLSEKVAGRLAKDNVFAFTIGIQVKTNSFHRHSVQTKLSDATAAADTIFRTASALSDKLLLGEHGLFFAESGIRLVGVFATDLTDGSFLQMNLWDYQAERETAETEKKKNERQDRLNAMTDHIRKKYGSQSIMRGPADLSRP